MTPFSKIYHNNNNFVVVFTKDIPTNKLNSNCFHCKVEFPNCTKITVLPFNIVLAHKERWMYRNQSRHSVTDPEWLPSPQGKETTKYYHLARRCIFERFPYFNEAFFECNLPLTQSHKNLIKQELDIEL